DPAAQLSVWRHGGLVAECTRSVEARQARALRLWAQPGHMFSRSGACLARMESKPTTPFEDRVCWREASAISSATALAGGEAQFTATAPAPFLVTSEWRE